MPPKKTVAKSAPDATVAADVAAPAVTAEQPVVAAVQAAAVVAPTGLANPVEQAQSTPIASAAAETSVASGAVAGADAKQEKKKLTRSPSKRGQGKNKGVKGNGKNKNKKSSDADDEEDGKRVYKMLAFDKGKVRVVGAYKGKSPSQAAKKAVKHGHNDIYLRRKGDFKVYLYVGSNEVLDKPVYGYIHIAADKDGKPVRKVIKTNDKTSQKLKDLNIDPENPAFTHSKVPVVRRVGFWPAGLD